MAELIQLAWPIVALIVCLSCVVSVSFFLHKHIESLSANNTAIANTRLAFDEQTESLRIEILELKKRLQSVEMPRAFGKIG